MDEGVRELFGTRAPTADACASDLTLDRHALGELDQNEATNLANHLRSCTRCRARSEELAIKPSVDPEVRRTVLARGARRRWMRVGVPLALAASLAVAFFAVDPGADTRRKGGLSLTVYRERNGEVVRGSSGDRFHPGDRLRFEVDAPAGHLLIIGVDAAGQRYACVPLDGRARRIESPLSKTLLPDAIELDASLGEERLVLVHCPRPFELASLEVRDRRVVAPDGCGTSELRFEKSR